MSFANRYHTELCSTAKISAIESRLNCEAIYHAVVAGEGIEPPTSGL